MQPWNGGSLMRRGGDHGHILRIMLDKPSDPSAREHTGRSWEAKSVTDHLGRGA